MIPTRTDIEDTQAVKLCITKTKPMGGDAGLYVGTVLHEYAAAHLHGKGRPERELCMVIDVFDQEVYVAPKANKRRLEDI